MEEQADNLISGPTVFTEAHRIRPTAYGNATCDADADFPNLAIESHRQGFIQTTFVFTPSFQSFFLRKRWRRPTVEVAISYFADLCIQTLERFSAAHWL